MSVAVHRTVFCDSCGHWHPHLDAPTAAAARRAAAKDGWQCKDKDLCPACRAKEDNGGPAA